MTAFNELPKDVQVKIKKDLGMYDQTHVYYENGKYNVSPHTVLSSTYAMDHQYIGTYKAKEVFTRDQHIEAQILAFGYSPTYNIFFYPNKDAWSNEAKSWQHVREQYIKNEIAYYHKLTGVMPSQDWIDRH